MANGVIFIAGMIFGGLAGVFLTIMFVGFCIQLKRDDLDDYLEEENDGN